MVRERVRLLPTFPRKLPRGKSPATSPSLTVTASSDARSVPFERRDASTDPVPRRRLVLFDHRFGETLRTNRATPTDGDGDLLLECAARVPEIERSSPRQAASILQSTPPAPSRSSARLTQPTSIAMIARAIPRRLVRFVDSAATLEIVDADHSRPSRAILVLVHPADSSAVICRRTGSAGTLVAGSPPRTGSTRAADQNTTGSAECSSTRLASATHTPTARRSSVRDSLEDRDHRGCRS